MTGTFVIRQPTSDARFSRFMRDLRAGSTRRLFAATHADFQDPGAFEARRLCGLRETRARCRAGGLRGSGPQMEYRLDPPLTGLCGTEAAKRAVLWYEFTVGKERYLFAKPESHPALSVRHLASAVARYIFKHERRGGLPPRREDAHLDRGGLDAAAALRESAADAARLWPAQAADAARYDRTARLGREVHVPAAVAAACCRPRDRARRNPGPRKISHIM